MRLLLVEDSDRLRRSLATGLRRSGYAVDLAADGPEGLWLAKSHDYDVVILDLMIPGLDGLSLLGKLRSDGKDYPVIILTARDTVEDRVKGLRAGADDYLVKPFAFDELLARIEALVRRRHGVKSSRVTVGPIEIDAGSRTVYLRGKPVPLTPREFSILQYLVARRGRVVSRTEVEAHIYDGRAEPMSNVIDSAICAIRRRIDEAGKPSLIATRRGLGYILGGDLP
jgi:DNA-binding response OmpR family regulator